MLLIYEREVVSEFYIPLNDYFAEKPFYIRLDCICQKQTLIYLQQVSYRLNATHVAQPIASEH